MYELAWTILGIAVALVGMQLWRTAARDRDPAASAAAAPEPRAQDEPVRTLPVALDALQLARSLADELASLVSGVEGRAHHLIEAAPTRTLLPTAAEALLAAVGRLRTLHTRLVAVGHVRSVESGATDVAELIASLGDELQQMQLGLELHWEPPAALPPIDANPAVVRDAMLFVCAALLRAERGATRLSFVAERSFSRERPTIKIELTLEWISDPRREDAELSTDRTLTLDLEAANQLITSHGGELTLSHLRGKSVSAVVRLPIAVPAELRSEPSSESGGGEPVGGRDFGGALVLESDPALRAVLARELKASGRAVFACADGASAHTFLEATPDRFELLIVDDLQQLEENTPLARTIRARAPALKICLLTPTPSALPTAWPALRCLRKPFGVHELRRTLASILTAG